MTMGNGLRAFGSNPSYWISIDEDEFADELRKRGWGERALEDELETLRTYKAQFHLDKKPVPTVQEVAEEAEAAAATGEKPKSLVTALFKVQGHKGQSKERESHRGRPQQRS